MIELKLSLPKADLDYLGKAIAQNIAVHNLGTEQKQEKYGDISEAMAVLKKHGRSMSRSTLNNLVKNTQGLELLPRMGKKITVDLENLLHYVSTGRI